jgi:putative ABC transport system substrate-binding protein
MSAFGTKRTPGGNVTGLSMMTSDLNSKRLQMLKDVVPGLTRAADEVIE